MSVVKTKIRKAFAEASESYDVVAALQREAGRGLLRHLQRPLPGARVIDLGCGTGFLGVELLVGEGLIDVDFCAVDIAMPMLNNARAKLRDYPAGFVCADAERLPFAAQTADVVLSNLAFQWCGSLDALFSDVLRVLKSDGQFIFTTFGPQTLQELRTAWQSVDDEPHVNEFADATDLSNIMKQAGFNDFTIYNQLYKNTYASVLELLHELKQLGAQTVVGSKRRTLTARKKLEDMMAAYPRCESVEGISATFEVITVSARISA